MHSRALIAVLFATCSVYAFADSVNKCKDAQGNVVYQSDPCEKTGSTFIKQVSGNDSSSPESQKTARAQSIGVIAGTDRNVEPRINKPLKQKSATLTN